MSDVNNDQNVILKFSTPRQCILGGFVRCCTSQEASWILRRGGHFSQYCRWQFSGKFSGKTMPSWYEKLDEYCIGSGLSCNIFANAFFEAKWKNWKQWERGSLPFLPGKENLQHKRCQSKSKILKYLFLSCEHCSCHASIVGGNPLELLLRGEDNYWAYSL